MRAVVVDRFMAPDALAVREVPDPTAGRGQLVVEVRAAGCNFADILVVQGKYQVKPPLPFVPGAELAGVVAAVGEGVTHFRVGDRVLGWGVFGAYAERAVVPVAAAHPLPDGMSFEEAAAFPMVYGTSYAALVDRARLRAGETLLVHAAAGGVGFAAVQIGVALGARVVGTAGGPEKLAVVRRAGAAVAIDYRAEDWVTRVRAETDDRGADVIYDPVGGDTFDQSLRCLAWNGRLLVVGFASGRIPEAKMNRVLLKNVALVGVHWAAYPQHEPVRVAGIFEELFALYRAGAVRPLVSQTFPLERLPDALRALGGRATVGKVVVVP